MKHAKWLALVLLAVLALPGFAGGKGDCTMTTQDCLDKMAEKIKNRGWVGIEMDKTDKAKGLMITRVVPGSPAEASGLQKGDILLSVNGAKYADNTEDNCATCEAMKKGWTPGSEVQYVIARGNKKMKVDLTLAQVPSDVMAQWVGQHMIDHTTVAVAKK